MFAPNAQAICEQAKTRTHLSSRCLYRLMIGKIDSCLSPIGSLGLGRNVSTEGQYVLLDIVSLTIHREHNIGLQVVQTFNSSYENSTSTVIALRPSVNVSRSTQRRSLVSEL